MRRLRAESEAEEREAARARELTRRGTLLASEFEAAAAERRRLESEGRADAAKVAAAREAQLGRWEAAINSITRFAADARAVGPMADEIVRQLGEGEPDLLVAEGGHAAAIVLKHDELKGHLSVVAAREPRSRCSRSSGRSSTPSPPTTTRTDARMA